MTANRDELVNRLRARLLAWANPAGWGYERGKTSRVEPTCWALLALGNSGTESQEAWAAFARPHVAFLAGLQSTDGLLVETDPALANLGANGLAAIVLANQRPLAPAATRSRLHGGLMGVKGARLQQIDPKQDSTLQGWPWVRDTFSWVEPTAWCVLALKVAGRDLGRELDSKAVTARQDEAERLLANRMCVGGGWNYGNAVALNQDLRPYVPTTAVALLSLQDRRDEDFAKQSLAWLQSQRLAEAGTMTLALVSLCLRLYHVPTDDVDDRLAEAVAHSDDRGNVHAIAMALYALTADQHHGDSLRVA